VTSLAAAAAAATPLWQTLLSLLGTAFVILGGMYAINKGASEATNKRLDDLKSHTDAQQSLATGNFTKELGHITDSLSSLSVRVERVTGRMDRVIEQQAEAARELAGQGAQLREVLDRRLGDLSPILARLSERVSQLEKRNGGGADPF
jgi:methyl-accepting chemotaxis protein